MKNFKIILGLTHKVGAQLASLNCRAKNLFVIGAVDGLGLITGQFTKPLRGHSGLTTPAGVSWIPLVFNMISLTKKSPYSGKENTMVLDTTKEALDEYYNGSDRLVQVIFPNLTVDEREFVMTGYTAEDWDNIF